MKDDSASYYDSREFTELLTSYENMLSDGGSVYFDSMDIANIAEYYSMSGELDKSDRAIEYGLRLHPSDADILISKANNLLRRGLKDEARVLTESISDPDNQELLYLKGEIELAFDRIDDADAYFTQAVQLSDNDPGMLNDIIVKYMDNRNYDLCQKWLDMALVLSPDSRNFIELQADLFFDTGQADTAIEWYNHLLDEFAYDTYYWDQLGRIYYEKNEFAKARECFEFIEAIEPEDKSSRMMKASCIFNMDDWKGAYDIYKALLEEDPASYTLLYYCGRCLYEMEMYADAYDKFMDTLAMLMLDDEVPEEMYVELYFYLADTAQRTERKEQAVRYIHDGLALDPNDKDLLELAQKLGIE
ncbi:MAG: tetratricopeptide repeat protein [Bacteroidaceae bacterium]|nr:tetratricopeptide repeat protein [Bacteroidaceae bacterium]